MTGENPLADAAVERVAANLTRVLEVARDEAITTEAAAERVAERRIASARGRRLP